MDCTLSWARPFLQPSGPPCSATSRPAPFSSACEPTLLQRWPESLFQTRTLLLSQNFSIRVLIWVRKFFKFEKPTPAQTPATIQKWQESLFQTPTQLLFQNFGVLVRIRQFFNLENPTPVQSPPAIINPTLVYRCFTSDMTTQNPATVDIEKWHRIQVRFPKCFTQGPGLKRKRRILPESTPVIRNRSHLCYNHKKWPHRHLLLQKLKSDSGSRSGVSQNFDTGTPDSGPKEKRRILL